MIAFIQAQGSLLSLRVAGFQSRPNLKKAHRGIIRTFSKAARRRLMRFMARLKVRKIRATFITLTFTEVVTNERAKVAFKRFAMRLRRRYPDASAVWRMEFQERGAIHFHLLAFNVPFWEQSDLQKTWEDCTEEDTSIVDIRLVHGARSITSYISKYIAKVDDRVPTSLEDVSYQHEGEKRITGRFWGWINKELLPLAQKFEGVLTDRDTIRSLSSYMWVLIGSDNTYNSISAHLFADNAVWLCERAIERGGCWMHEWAYTTKDHVQRPSRYGRAEDFFPEHELELEHVQALGRLIKGERSELVQPLISGWLAQASLTRSSSDALH